MTLEKRIHLIAGSFVLAGLSPAHFVGLYGLWFTAFAGVNLFQSVLPHWRLMETILKRLDVREARRS